MANLIPVTLVASINGNDPKKLGVRSINPENILEIKDSTFVNYPLVKTAIIYRGVWGRGFKKITYYVSETRAAITTLANAGPPAA